MITMKSQKRQGNHNSVTIRSENPKVLPCCLHPSSIQGVLPLQLQEAFKEVKMPYRLDEHSPQHCSAANDEVINDIQRLEIEECAQRRYGQDAYLTGKQSQDHQC